MQYLRANRYPDDFLVRLPAYYADHGGPGWYPELQCPQQAHLTVQYHSALRKDVYIQPKAFFMSRIKEELGKQGIREILYSFGAERGFPCQRQAEDVLIIANRNSHLLVSSSSELKARYPETNSRDFNSASTRDILLVCEELPLKSAYIPTVASSHPAHLPSSQPSRWNAVGYARDAFVNKRKLTEYDPNLYPLAYNHLPDSYDKPSFRGLECEGMERCGAHDLGEAPSPRKRRLLAHHPLPSSLHRYVDMPELRYDDYEVSFHLGECVVSSVLQCGRKSPYTTSQIATADYSQRDSTLRSTLWSPQQPPKKKIKKRKSLFKTKYALGMGTGTYVGDRTVPTGGTVLRGVNDQRRITFLASRLCALNETIKNQTEGETQVSGPSILSADAVECMRQIVLGNGGGIEPLSAAETLIFNEQAQAELGRDLTSGNLPDWKRKVTAAWIKIFGHNLVPCLGPAASFWVHLDSRAVPPHHSFTVIFNFLRHTFTPLSVKQTDVSQGSLHYLINQLQGSVLNLEDQRKLSGLEKSGS
ncbi:hypothetical protein I352_01803 [Cryptococcus deuterogattii MMRL2647]|nr:hypothetical protein I352_01803 [Cryptococcus deuterogattii MMRL2647]